MKTLQDLLNATTWLQKAYDNAENEYRIAVAVVATAAENVKNARLAWTTGLAEASGILGHVIEYQQDVGTGKNKRVVTYKLLVEGVRAGEDPEIFGQAVNRDDSVSEAVQRHIGLDVAFKDLGVQAHADS